MSEPLGAGIEEPPDRNGAFPRLDEEQRGRLRAIGEVVPVSPGDVLFRDGDEAYDFYVVESGAAEEAVRAVDLPGFFAVGDVHSGSIKRVASAVGEGSMAVRLAYQRLVA